MEHAIEYLEAELNSLKDAWREDTQGLRDVYISRIIDVKEALCHLKKISERQERSETTKQHDSKALHIADVSNSLVAFMVWYKNNVPIGTQKSSKEIVSDYLSNL